MKFTHALSLRPDSGKGTEVFCQGHATKEKILALYLKHGRNFARHLSGDFVAVVLDREKRKIFAARDPMGQLPLYYVQINGTLHISDDPTALSAMPGFSRKLDEEALAFFLLDFYCLYDRTFYQGLRRLPPGHLLECGADGSSRMDRYFSFVPGDRLSLSPSDYGERCLQLLREAVRIRAGKKTGIFLSGGLDSSSLAALTSEVSDPLLLAAQFQDPAASDEGMLEAVSSHLGRGALRSFPERDLASTDLNPEPGWVDLLYSPNFFFLRPLLDLAKEKGADGIFLGHGGDDLFIPPPSYLHDLLRGGNWRGFRRELRALSESRRERLAFSWSYALKPFLPPVSAQAFRRLKPGKLPAWCVKDFFRKHQVQGKVAERFSRERQAARAAGIRERYRQDLYLRFFGSGTHAFQMEQQHLLAKKHGMEFRYPYFDLDLALFVFQLPLSQLQTVEQGKVVLRSAMQGLLPEEVRLKPKFQDYDPLDQLSLKRQAPYFRSLLENSALAQLGAVDEKKLNAHWDVLCIQDPDAAYRIIHAERWLRAL
ncbi:MAG TPA: asparagine synthase-related protein [Bdellovibrionota bacterium]|jgi:asparagine synthase (glutamine-hydrolysing)